ncbi:MAG: SBBP repeat-containing protein, partial [Cyanobacteria bacterium J06641_2]
MENNQEQQSVALAMMDNASDNTSTTTKANPKVTVDFAKNFGGEFSDDGFGIDVDKEGNIYLAGAFSFEDITLDDIKLENSGSSDAFVVKLDKTGKVIWAEKIGGSSNDAAYGIKVDEAGNPFVTGSFRNTATFGSSDMSEEKEESEIPVAERISGDSTNQIPENPSLISNPEETNNPTKDSFNLASGGSPDGFITKFDTNGKVQWVKQFGGKDFQDSAFGEGITLDSQGNSYVTGTFKDEIKFGELELTSNGSNDGFVTKYNADGTVAWANNFGGDAFDKGSEIAVDAAGNSYVTGLFKNSATFGSFTLNGGTKNDIFVTKLDDAGNFKWAKNFGGTVDDKGNGITVDKLGNTFITGSFRSTASFGDTSLKSNGLSDGFITKLDTEGNVKWAKKFGGKSNDEGFGITLDESENIYLTGSFEDEIKFGDNTLKSSAIDDKDAFIVKLDNLT